MPVFERLRGALRALSSSPASERPPSSKGGSGVPLVALQQTGQPVWMPRDYGTFAREGFMRNAVVYRSVRMIAEAAASVPVLLYEGGQPLSDHPLLALLEKPNPLESRPDLMERWYGYLLISGNAYLEAVKAGGRVRELYALRPDRMKVVPGCDGWPDAYEYTVGQQTCRYRQEDSTARPILHMSLFHPLSDHYGMSPIEAAATAIDIHNAAGSWNKALLDNSARPSGALVYTSGSGHLSNEQFDRLRRELDNTYQGAINAGRPMLLEGGLDWKSMSMTPRDMDFIDAKHAAAREIALALGVPPMLLGIPGDNTYSNYQEANRVFWRQTVLPLVNRTLKAIAGWLGPQSGAGGVELRPALDRIEALSSERAALWERLRGANFLSENEKRREAGFPDNEAALQDAVKS
jgi:HK97 family phage portal protein